LLPYTLKSQKAFWGFLISKWSKTMEGITYLNDRQVAKMIGCSISKLRNDRHLGQGIPYRKINRLCLYRLDEVIDFIESRKIETENL
jgi:hypothetical protein